jgi:hypothetical protein
MYCTCQHAHSMRPAEERLLRTPFAPPRLRIANRGAVQAPSRGPLATMTSRHGRRRRLARPASPPLGVATFCRAVSHGVQSSARPFHASMPPRMSFVTATQATAPAAHAFVPPLQASMPPTDARKCPPNGRQRRWNATTESYGCICDCDGRDRACTDGDRASTDGDRASTDGDRACGERIEPCTAPLRTCEACRDACNSRPLAVAAGAIARNARVGACSAGTVDCGAYECHCTQATTPPRIEIVPSTDASFITPSSRAQRRISTYIF